MPSAPTIADLLSTRATLARIGAYEITDDPHRVDVSVVHAVLSRECPRWQGLTRDQVGASLRMSLPISVHAGGGAPRMVGLLRVVTDTVAHAWLDDLFVLREHRHRGLASALVAAALQHPSVAGVPRQWLHTARPDRTYAGHGFRRLPDAGALLVRQQGAPGEGT